MALQGASGSGEWLSRDEWNALGDEGARVLFRVHAHQPERKMTNGPVYPVDCEVLILSGSRAGQYHPDQSVIGRGLTTPLRKVAVGNDMLAVMGTGMNGATKYPQANPPEAGDLERAGELYADGKDPFREAQQQAAGGPALVGAGTAPDAGSSNGQAPAAGGKRPW